ncbi:hypothetical protein ACPPVV_16770 [Rhodanobacter sp. Col0626]|uniref:hypothetical protein n=1 Tax=Rhodanobacter sp. Col0626 TaxID=3415679 RepID=UPI003CF407AC
MRHWQRICLSAVAFVSFVANCHAQSTVTPEDEYKKLIRVSEDIQPLGATPFGESVSLYNGSLSFDQTDISLAGDGPVLQLSRSYHLREAKESESIDGAFSDWDVEIPRITTMTANQANVTGWQTRQAGSNARCTLFGPPPTVAPQQGGADWEPTTWWTGYQLIVPGSGSQDLLTRALENTLSPNMSGKTFPIVTKQNWMVSCGVLTDNETNGEGFLAIAPDGTKYTFNHLVYRWAPSMNRPIGSGPLGLQSFGVHPMSAPDDFLRRRQASMLVTRVEDRFGNFLIYHYDGANLSAITASDGRALNLTYVPGTSRIDKVTLQASDAPLRTWHYYYGTDIYHVLNNVTLPDSTSWTFDMANFLASDMDPAGGTCSRAALLSTDPWTGSITHPSGLVGTFLVKGMVHGRSYVPRICHGTGNDAPGSTAAIPRVYYQLTLMQKTFSGAGVPAETWHYNYSEPNESWSQDCTSGCASTIWTDVVNPLGQATRYTFSNRFDVTEGQLISTDFYNGAVGTTLLRSEDNDYAAIPKPADPWPWPWPERYGSVLQSSMNKAQVEQLAPQTVRMISQDDDTYTWQAESFDAYAQVTKTKRFSSTFSQCLPTSTQCIEEQTGYLNDPLHWVLGLPAKVTNVATGEVESENVYSAAPSNPVLQSRARFGQTLMSYTFNDAGQLASFTDGNGNQTTLGAYKRGIPTSISLPGDPDRISESLVVNDFGEIKTLTDPAGHTTRYGYDEGGRVKEIDYPSGDEQTWNSTVITTVPVASAERGLGANHWRRTQTIGDATTVTYFDALLRPVLTDSKIGTSVKTTTLVNYDAKGQKIYSSYPSDAAPAFTLAPTLPNYPGVTTSYDALGRVVRSQRDSELGKQTATQGKLTTTIAYLPGARMQVTDPKGNLGSGDHVTTTSYQVFDQPNYDAVIKVQAPTGITQTIVRDVYGAPTSIMQGPYGNQTNGLTKSLHYDTHHRLCRTSEPESGDTVMSYDAANNVNASASGLAEGSGGADGCGNSPMPTTAITFDHYPSNRLRSVLAPIGTQSAEYHYDKLGNVTSVVSGITTWTGAYNFRGMLTGESLQVGDQNTWGIGYAHDANGGLSLIHYPDGENVNYAPDALGRPTQAGSYASGIGYFANGQVSDFIYGNGAAYMAEQNDRQLLSSFSYGPGTAQLSEELSYDANGNIIAVTDLAGGPRTKGFGYDALNRLTSARADGLLINEAYTYDALNNLSSHTSGGQILTYNYDATNKLTSITQGANAVSSYVYDNRGNVISNNGTNLTFDQKNQLTGIQNYDDYNYDVAGRRVKKTPTGGTPTYYFYNQAGQLLYQYEPASNKATGFIYLGTKMIARNSLLLVIPDTPASITVPGSSAGNYTVSWGDGANAASYVLEQSVNGGAWTSIYTGSGLSQTMHQTANGSYAYRVKACNVIGCSAYRTSTPVVVTLPPTAAPTVNAPATNSTGIYTVSWNGVAAAATYILEEQVNGAAWTTQQNTSATSKAFSGKTNASYGYRVRASNAGGPGPLSTTQVVVVGLIPAAPAAPHITISGPEWKPVFALTWSAVPWATRYEVEELNSDGAMALYNGPNTTTSALVLDEGTVSFRVRACSSYGCSAWSGYTSHGGSGPIPTPTLTAPASNSTGSYTVSWTGVPGIVRYTLQERANGGSWITVLDGNATSMSISGKTNGSYSYQARDCNPNRCGLWSATRTVAVGKIPAVPAAPHVSASGPNFKPTVKVSWAAVVDATSYEVEMIEPGEVEGETYYAYANLSMSMIVFATGTVRFRVHACNAIGCSAWSGYGSVSLQSGS